MGDGDVENDPNKSEKSMKSELFRIVHPSRSTGVFAGLMFWMPWMCAPLWMLLPVCGCAVTKAMQQPIKRDLGVLREGTDRAEVIAKLGAPLTSEKVLHGVVEVFELPHSATAISNSTTGFDSAAAFLSFGLWKPQSRQPLIPSQRGDGFESKVEVTYNEEQKIASVRFLEKTEPHSKFASYPKPHPIQSDKAAAQKAREKYAFQTQHDSSSPSATVMELTPPNNWHSSSEVLSRDPETESSRPLGESRVASLPPAQALESKTQPREPIESPIPDEDSADKQSVPPNGTGSFFRKLVSPFSKKTQANDRPSQSAASSILQSTLPSGDPLEDNSFGQSAVGN